MDRAKAKSLAARWAEGANITLRDSEAREYHKLCLAALREQEQREQGCKYCNTFDDVMATETVCYIPADSGGAVDIPVNVCPNCGRKLGGAE